MIINYCHLLKFNYERQLLTLTSLKTCIYLNKKKGAVSVEYFFLSTAGINKMVLLSFRVHLVGGVKKLKDRKLVGG